MRRAAAAILIATALGASLTGCGRFNQNTPPVPAASTPASTDSDDLLAELDSVDDLLTQSEQDAVAGDEAARTDDAP
jgi:hypothetical protein